MGRPRLPTSVIELRGGTSHYHRTKEELESEPQPNPNIPPCPSHLDETGKQEWIRISTELDECGILTNLDMAVFAAYCEAYSTWVRNITIVHKEGDLVTAPSGYQIQHPALGIANRAEVKMIKAANEMGITPSGRSRVKRVEKPKESKKERFFKI